MALLQVFKDHMKEDSMVSHHPLSMHLRPMSPLRSLIKLGNTKKLLFLELNSIYRINIPDLKDMTVQCTRLPPDWACESRCMQPYSISTDLRI